ncbi:MAG: DUF1997 domain-containing protein [Chloroflexaceae bacterium]|nr:DUF1997 domain-containing protein [Chloroflexaceae bacterium]
MTTRFIASETVELAVNQQQIPIQHYLRQPQRLVRAIANPNLMEQLSENRFRLKLSPLNFLDLYQFQPVAILGVWADGQGTVYIKSESCEIRGIDYINDRFTLDLQGKLAPLQQNGQTFLRGRADLEVRVELPLPLQLTPRPILETTGNGLLKGVLTRIKQRLLSQLLKDYRQWATAESGQPQPGTTLSAAENSPA